MMTGGRAVLSAQIYVIVVIYSLLLSCMFVLIPPCSYKVLLNSLLDFLMHLRRKPFLSILYECRGLISCLTI
jgi:hypothetical protein